MCDPNEQPPDTHLYLLGRAPARAKAEATSLVTDSIGRFPAEGDGTTGPVIIRIGGLPGRGKPLVIHRYPGGKTRHWQWIESHFPEHRRYVEGFAGVATVLINRPRAKEEFLIEKNPDQAVLLRVIRDHPHELARVLRPLRWSIETFVDARLRLDEQLYSSDIERAAWAYTARKMSMNGEGQEFSVVNNRDPEVWWDGGVRALPAIARRLRGAHIIEGDALEWLPLLDGPETLFYLDPPYVLSSRIGRSLYGRYEMTDSEHRALCRTVRRLVGKVVLSGYPNPIYDEVLSGWRRETCRFRVFAKYSEGGIRIKKTEVLWLNF